MKIPDNVYEELGFKKPDIRENTPIQVTGRVSSLPQCVKDATADNPVYLKVSCFGRDAMGEKFAHQLCACMGIETITVEENKYYSYNEDRLRVQVIEGEKIGHGRLLPLDGLTIEEIIPRTKNLDKKWAEAINGIKVSITGHVYEEYNIISKDDLYSIHPKVLSTTEFTPADVHDLKSAEKWMIKNHPEQYLGCNITTSTGDFMLGAIPLPYTYCDNLREGTFEGREQIVKEIAGRNGWEMGNFDYEICKKASEIEYEDRTSEEKLYDSFANRNVPSKEEIENGDYVPFEEYGEIEME